MSSNLSAQKAVPGPALKVYNRKRRIVIWELSKLQLVLLAV